MSVSLCLVHPVKWSRHKARDVRQQFSRFAQSDQMKTLALFYHWSTRRLTTNKNAWKRMKRRKKNNANIIHGIKSCWVAWMGQHRAMRERRRTSSTKRFKVFFWKFLSIYSRSFLFSCVRINWKVFRTNTFAQTHTHIYVPTHHCVDAFATLSVDSYLIYVY